MLVICPTVVHAEDPPAGNADAVDCTDTILEREIGQGNMAIRPQNLRIYDPYIKPILQLGDRLPEFGNALRKAMNKKWRFGFDKIQGCPRESSELSDLTHKVACQTSSEVIINPDWYTKLNPSSCKLMSNSGALHKLDEKQRDLFVHELLLGITLGTGISVDNSDLVFNALTRRPLPTVDELRAVLETAHFGVYATRSDCAEPASNQETLQPIQNASRAISAAVAPVLANQHKVCTKDKICVGDRVLTDSSDKWATVFAVNRTNDLVVLKNDDGTVWPGWSPTALYVAAGCVQKICTGATVVDSDGKVGKVVAIKPSMGLVGVQYPGSTSVRGGWAPSSLSTTGI